MKMKSYNIGKMKIEDNKVYNKKLAILEQVKKIVIKKGWSEKILSELIKKEFTNSDLILCFNKEYINVIEQAMLKVNQPGSPNTISPNFIAAKLTDPITSTLKINPRYKARKPLKNAAAFPLYLSS